MLVILRPRSVLSTEMPVLSMATNPPNIAGCIPSRPVASNRKYKETTAALAASTERPAARRRA
ncbi:hypothetical protein D3C74_332240 [compost metagenome]